MGGIVKSPGKSPICDHAGVRAESPKSDPRSRQKTYKVAHETLMDEWRTRVQYYCATHRYGASHLAVHLATSKQNISRWFVTQTNVPPAWAVFAMVDFKERDLMPTCFGERPGYP